jgi:hypothetical protein
MSDQKPTPEEIENAHSQVAKAYLTALLEILQIQGHGELNYVKKTITTPKGGIYLLQFQHVSGPVIDCQNLSDLS